MQEEFLHLTPNNAEPATTLIYTNFHETHMRFKKPKKITIDHHLENEWEN
jgi:hypothetical protein